MWHPPPTAPAKNLRTTEDLDALLNSMQEQIDTLKESASGKQARIKELDELLRMTDYYQQGKPVADKLKTIRFEKSLLAPGDRDHILSGVFNQFLSEKSEPAE